MRGAFSSDKIFFKSYYHNNFVAVDTTLIFDIEFKWKFLVCENYISADIPCLIDFLNLLTQQNFQEFQLSSISEIKVCEGNVDFHDPLQKNLKLHNHLSIILER